MAVKGDQVGLVVVPVGVRLAPCTVSLSLIRLFIYVKSHPHWQNCIWMSGCVMVCAKILSLPASIKALLPTNKKKKCSKLYLLDIGYERFCGGVIASRDNLTVPPK